MIVDKETRRMLDTLNASTPDRPCRVFTFERIAELMSAELPDILPAINGLIKQDFAETANYKTPRGPVPMGITLTQRGIKYRELLRLEAAERWKERLFGFISGVALTLLAALIARWL